MAPPFGHKGRKGHPGIRQDNSRSKVSAQCFVLALNLD